MSREFWLDWIEADELERLKMIKTLTPFTRVNSYLVDLYNAVKKK
jgi:hypothetical protein